MVMPAAGGIGGWLAGQSLAFIGLRAAAIMLGSRYVGFDPEALRISVPTLFSSTSFSLRPDELSENPVVQQPTLLAHGTTSDV